MGLLHYVKLDWPPPLAYTFNMFSFFLLNLGVFRVECSVGTVSYRAKTIALLAMPAALMAVVAGIMALVVLRCGMRKREERDWRPWWVLMGQLAVVVSTVGFMFIFQQIVSTFDCLPQYAGGTLTYTLRGDPGKCF